MAGRYGALWMNSHGDHPGKVDMGEWGGLIEPLTEAQIREGFESDGFRGSDFPPSSTHFRAMCLGLDAGAEVPREQRPGGAMYQPWAPRGKRIESDRCRDVAERELDAMARALHIVPDDAA